MFSSRYAFAKQKIYHRVVRKALSNLNNLDCVSPSLKYQNKAVEIYREFFFDSCWNENKYDSCNNNSK